MSKRDFLVEIGSEEMPPKSLFTMAAAFAGGIARELNGASIPYRAMVSTNDSASRWTSSSTMCTECPSSSAASGCQAASKVNDQACATRSGWLNRAAAGRKHDVLAHGEIGENARRFRHIGDAGAGDVGRRPGGDVAAVEADAA